MLSSSRRMRGVPVWAFGFCVLSALLVLSCTRWTSAALAQTRAQQRLAVQQQQAQQATYNERALLVVASHPRHSYVGIATDISGMLGGNGAIRLIPLMGDGGPENLKDLLFLRGADMAIVPSNVLYSKKTAEALGGNLQQKLVYVARLYGEELHLLAGRAIGSLEELSGKKVAVPIADGNALFAATDVLQRLAIQADIVQTDPVTAIDQVRSGEIAAVVLVGGKPLSVVSGLPKDGSLRFLDLRPAHALDDGYAPAAFRAEDYPTLLPPDAVVETVSVSAVLVARNTKEGEDSYRRIETFVPLFFRGLTELIGPPRHPKWRDVNLGAAVTGWPRFAPAEQWLESAKTQQAAWLQKSFEDFLRTSNVSGLAPLSPAQRQKLFDEFVSWTRKSVAHPAQSTRQ
jgi:TRAP-type uncharacterized transport system substrate-binding protein